jgi:hypothetical protein
VQQAAVRDAFAQAVLYGDAVAPRCLVLADSMSRSTPDTAMLKLMARNHRGEPVYGSAECPRTYAMPGGYVDPGTGRPSDPPAPHGWRDPVIVTIWTPQVTAGAIAPFRVEVSQGSGGRWGLCERVQSATTLSCNLTGTVAH